MESDHLRKLIGESNNVSGKMLAGAASVSYLSL